MGAKAPQERNTMFYTYVCGKCDKEVSVTQEEIQDGWQENGEWHCTNSAHKADCVKES